MNDLARVRSSAPILDAHTHVWQLALTPQPWIPAAAAPIIARDFTIDDLRAAIDATPVQAVILVQSANDAAETDALLELAEAHPWVAGVVGWLDLMGPDPAGAIDRLAAASPGSWLCGVRHVFDARRAATFLGAPAVGRALDVLGGRGLAFDLLLSSGELGLAAALARRHPDVTFVLDHLAKPSLRHGEIEPWRSDLLELGRCENLVAKLSGLPGEADWVTWSDEDLRPYLATAWEAFGPRRLIFATDWPVCTVAGSYGRVLDAQLAFVQGLSESEQASVLWENARRVYPSAAVPAGVDGGARS